MVTSSIAIETRRKVLLVDDDAVSLELMSLLLAHEGHEVVPAGNAGLALQLLTAAPDVLLVDLQMPGISGEQLAKQVRSQSTSARCPLLLAMSATAVAPDQLLSFDGFLLKPLALEDLRNALSPRQQPRRTGMRVVRSNKPVPSPGTKSAGAIDRTVVDKLLAMMPAEALELTMSACLADTRASIAGIKQHAAAGDTRRVRETAHRIKGAAQMVGATRLAKLAAGLEAGGDQPAATPTVLNDLLNAVTELEGMLLAGKFRKSRAPHHEPSNHTGNT